VVYEKIPSFFDIFQTIDMTNKDEKDDEEEEGDEQAEKMDEDMELGNEIKDNIIPLALEIYLGVVELGDSEEEDMGDEEDDDMDDDDMPKMPKGMKLPKNFKPGKKGAPNPEDCKQQ
jgi:nucleosome assembly protein 1-like 1